MMMPGTEDALREHCMAVVHCENARAVLSQPLLKLSPDQLKCSTVARSQLLAASKREKLDHRLRWHVPEPWNGRLATAPILFIGQNPSVDHREDYPTTWHVQGDGVSPDVDRRLLDFFNGRFEKDLDGPPIIAGTRVRLREGGYANKPNRFLEHVGQLAKACLGHTVEAGIDYAITEAVRCKGPRPPGIDQASQVCARKHLTKTLQLSKASVLICLGREARVALRTVFDTLGLVNLPKPLQVNKPFKLGRWYLLCLEHSGARDADNEHAVSMAVNLRKYLARKATRVG